MLVVDWRDIGRRPLPMDTVADVVDRDLGDLPAMVSAASSLESCSADSQRLLDLEWDVNKTQRKSKHLFQQGVSAAIQGRAIELAAL
jgi:hypothetical protein